MHGASDVLQSQIFREAPGQQQARLFRLLAMNTGSRRAAPRRVNAAAPIGVPHQRDEQVQRPFINHQTVLRACEQTLADALMEKEDCLLGERVSEVEQALRAIRNGGLKKANDFPQQFRAKSEHGAVVAAFDRVRATIRLVLVEEQNVIRIGDELAPSHLLQEYTRTWKDNVIPNRVLFRTALPKFRTTADIVNRDAAAAIKRM